MNNKRKLFVRLSLIGASLISLASCSLIQKIISGANEILASSQTNSIDYDNAKDNWRERAIEIVDYRDKMKNEGLELFSKYFWNLWD